MNATTPSTSATPSTGATPGNAIAIDRLACRYPNGFEAISDLSLTIRENEFVAIIGQNGAGKSTLLKHLIGLLKPASGNIVIDGVNTRDTSVARLATRVGFVLQNPDRQLFADSVEAELRFGPTNLGLTEDEIAARVETALEQTGLQAMRKEYPMALSAGDRAKVVIASVIAMQPRIIILDEPTTGQDRRGCAQIMQIAKRFQEQGRTVVMVTHHMALVAEYAERTVVMGKGKKLLDGPTAEVFAQEDILRESFVMPPQVTRLGRALQPVLGHTDTILRPDALAERMVQALRA